MLNQRKGIGAMLVVALAAAALYAAWRPPGPAAADEPRVLRRGIGAEPESLDPQRARSEAALTVLRDLDEGLTAIGADGKPQLAAADRVEVSADGMTYTFRLRSRARWSNGAPVVAADFVTAWRRLVDPKTASQYAGLLVAVKNAAAIERRTAPPAALGVNAPDAATLVVELDRPTPEFLAIVSHPATFPLDAASLAAHPQGFAKPGVMVSNGAFVLASWQLGSRLVAKRNRFYWNDAATRFGRVEYLTTNDPAAELRAYRAGGLDITSTIPPDAYSWVEKHLPGQLRVAPELAVYYLGFNLTRAPFANDPQLRLALSMVIDRRRLVESVTGGGERPAYTFVPDGIDGYTPPLPAYAHWPMAERIARARELLRAAHSGQGPLKVELRYNTGELHDRIAVAVAAMWKDALGVETTLHAEEFKALLQDINRADATEAFRASWVGDYNDAYSFLQVLQTGVGIDPPRYSNTGYDDLLTRAGAERDAVRRAALLAQAEKIMLGDQPVVPLYFYVAKHLVSPKVRGWRGNVMNVVYDKDLAKVP